MVCLLAALAASTTWVGCGGSEGDPNGDPPGDAGTTQDAGVACEDGPYFSMLPVPLETIASVIPLGQFNPPGDVYPRAQSGMLLHAGTIDVVTPGPIFVRTVRRNTWLESPWRQGTTDYSVGFTIEGCSPIEGGYHHLHELSEELEAYLTDEHCGTYSTDSEVIEACSNSPDFTMAAGEAIGGVSSESAIGLDFDFFDSRVEHPFISPHRVHAGVLRAICMHHLFEEPMATQLTELVGRWGLLRTDEPRCGTMEVDREGTAQGMWITEGPDASLSGDTYHRFLALAPHDIQPSTHQIIAAAIPELDRDNLHVFARQATGRVNLDFGQVLPNGDIHCYFSDNAQLSGGYEGYNAQSFFVALDGEGILTIERLTHAADVSPCANDPSTWAFGAAALRYMR
jgi:hypothetical protein